MGWCRRAGGYTGSVPAVPAIWIEVARSYNWVVLGEYAQA